MWPVDPTPAERGLQTQEDTDQTVCYRHQDTPTKLRCSRCDRPICGRCATPASVGQHCPECVADARRSAPKVRSAMQAKAPVVLSIIVACVIVYVLQMANDAVTFNYAMNPYGVYLGEWWRLFTAMFLHSPTSFIHIIFNMYVLYMYGPQVEDAFGHVRFALLYVAAGLAGSAASYAVGCDGGVGASGAIFGIVGVLVVYLRNRGHMALVNSLLAFIGINLVIGFVIPNIDNAAHIGGLVGGLALGYGFDNGGRVASTARQIATLALVVGISVAVVMWRTANFSCGPFG
jgi:membrane associated rhomboid family serine protease